MIICIRTITGNKDFQKLVAELDADLKTRDGKDHLFYSQFNKIDSIKYVIVAYENEMQLGCGALKEYSKNTLEVKRMYVSLNKRGQGVASAILKELEIGP